MLDPKLLRDKDQIQTLVQKLQDRGYKLDTDKLQKLEEQMDFAL